MDDNVEDLAIARVKSAQLAALLPLFLADAMETEGPKRALSSLVLDLSLDISCALRRSD